MENLQDKDFKTILQEAFCDEVAQKALLGLSTPSSTSIRFNPSKMPSDLSGEPVQWSPLGRILEKRPVFTLDPLLHAGCYYVQDSSAMFVGDSFRKALQKFSDINRPLRVLDLCAAPGGKTTDLAASLRQSRGDNFILVANEVMRQRASVLCDNVSLWGDPCVVVTSLDPKAFSSLEDFFDIIVADVPCSGEGMFRKDAQAVSEWSLDTVALCQGRQRRIIADVWPSLRQNGVMIYSTCTFNSRENDGNVEWISEQLGADIVSNDEDFEGVIKTKYGYGLVPGFVKGEGQYCASLMKTSGGSLYPLKAKGKPSKKDSPYSYLFDMPMVFFQKGETLLAYPQIIDLEIQAISCLRPIRTGVMVGTMKGQTLVPDADLSLCISLSKTAFERAELDKGTALAFLHRDTFVLPDAKKGFVAVCYDGHPIGFVKNLGNRCNNLHPAGRRIRMDVADNA